MATWYYFNNDGQKKGPFTSDQLKELVKQGVVMRETMLENDAGQTGPARKVKTLPFPPLPSPSPVEENPFIGAPPESDNPFTAPMPGVKQAKPKKVPKPAYNPKPDAKWDKSTIVIVIVGIVAVLVVCGIGWWVIFPKPEPEPIPMPAPPPTPQQPGWEPVPVPEPQPVNPVTTNTTLIAPNDDRVYYFNSTCMAPPSTGLFQSLVTTYIDSGGTARRSHGGPEIMKNVRSVHTIGGADFFITTKNELWAKGRNEDGYVGDDTGLDRDSPVLVMKDVANLYFDRGVVYAIKTDKSRWGWGPGVKNGQTAYAPVKLDNNYNANEELSARHIITVNERYDTIKIDEEYRSDLPMDISDKTTASLLASVGLNAGNIVAIRSTTRSQYIDSSLMGSRKTPVRYYALDKAGVLWGWGYNDGILGDGTKANRNRAVKIAENVSRIMPRFFVTKSNDWFFYSNVAFNENATLQNKSFAPYVPRIAFENCLYTFACYGDKGIFAYNFPDNVWFTPDGKLVYSSDGSGVYESGGFKVHEIISDIKLPSIVRASDGQVIAPRPEQIVARITSPRNNPTGSGIDQQRQETLKNNFAQLRGKVYEEGFTYWHPNRTVNDKVRVVFGGYTNATQDTIKGTISLIGQSGALERDFTVTLDTGEGITYPVTGQIDNSKVPFKTHLQLVQLEPRFPPDYLRANFDLVCGNRFIAIRFTDNTMEFNLHAGPMDILVQMLSVPWQQTR